MGNGVLVTVGVIVTVEVRVDVGVLLGVNDGTNAAGGRESWRVMRKDSTTARRSEAR